MSSITPADLPDDEEPQDGFEELRGFDPDSEPIEGLGRDAFRSPIGVTVLTDDAVLLVVTTGELRPEQLEGLAAFAVERAVDDGDGDEG